MVPRGRQSAWGSEPPTSSPVRPSTGSPGFPRANSSLAAISIFREDRILLAGMAPTGCLSGQAPTGRSEPLFRRPTGESSSRVASTPSRASPRAVSRCGPARSGRRSGRASRSRPFQRRGKSTRLFQCPMRRSTRPEVSIGREVVADGLARWDGAAWSAADAQVKARVNCLTKDAAGRLIAGFSGDVVGPALSRGITRRTAQGWTSLGSGNSGRITAMAKLPNGDVIVGGAFQRLAASN